MIQKPHSLVAVTVTPFSEGCRPNLDEICRQTETLCGTGAEVLFPCASTGEFVCMETEDKLAVLRAVSGQNRGRKALFAGAADASLEGVLRYVEAAKRWDYDACVICPPYYYPLSQEEVFRFYAAVSDAAEGMPVYAYHVPFFTTGIETDTFRRLLELPAVAGMKDSAQNLKRIAHLCDIARRERPGFEMYTGTDDCLLPSLVAGCHGNMTALTASMPDAICAIYRAFRAGDLPGAMAAQAAILPVLRLCDSLPFPLGYKVLAKVTGLKTETFTHPRAAEVESAIRALLGKEEAP